METVDCSETSMSRCQAIRCQIPEDGGRQRYCLEKLKPHMEIKQVFRQTETTSCVQVFVL